MSIKTVIGALATFVVGLGAFYFVLNGSRYQALPGVEATDRQPTQSSIGTFSYECDNGASLTMAPADDMSEVTLAPNGAISQGKVPNAILAAQAQGGPASFAGQGVTMVGAGEELTITWNNQTIHCNPVNNPDMAPFNWGDAGDGGASAWPAR